jgi:hypothetical protein
MAAVDGPLACLAASIGAVAVDAHESKAMFYHAWASFMADLPNSGIFFINPPEGQLRRFSVQQRPDLTQKVREH